MKYKVGDKVEIVRKRTSSWNTYGEMDKWFGKTMTIHSLRTQTYRMLEDDGRWFWDDAMIVGLSTNVPTTETKPQKKEPHVYNVGDTILFINKINEIKDSVGGWVPALRVAEGKFCRIKSIDKDIRSRKCYTVTKTNDSDDGKALKGLGKSEYFSDTNSFHFDPRYVLCKVSTELNTTHLEKFINSDLVLVLPIESDALKILHKLFEFKTTNLGACKSGEVIVYTYDGDQDAIINKKLKESTVSRMSKERLMVLNTPQDSYPF